MTTGLVGHEAALPSGSGRSGDGNWARWDSELGACQVDTFKIGERVVRFGSERAGLIWMEPSEREQVRLALELLGILFLLFLVLVGIITALVSWHRRRGRAVPPKTARPSTTRAARSRAGVLDTPVLGGKREAWVRAKGNPTKGVIGELFAPDTEVIWARDATGTDRAQYIELLLRSAITVAQARDQAKPFHPPDARLTRTYVAPAGQTVEVFQSDLLAQALAGVTRRAIGSLPAAPRVGDGPLSTYTQIAERGSPTTNRVVIAVGNNP